MVFDVSPQLLEAGLGVAAVVVRGLEAPPVSPELLACRKRQAERLATHLKNRSVASHPAVAGLRAVRGRLGLADAPSMPEKVLSHVRRNRDVAPGGALGDCAALVAARTLAGVAVRDLAARDGAVSFAVNDVDLGLAPSDVTPASRDVLFLLHADAVVGPAGLLEAAWLLAEMVERFCGGRGEVAGFAWPARAAEAVAGDAPLPTVPYQVFQPLALHVGRPGAPEPLAEAPGLAALPVQAEGPLRALVPLAALPSAPSGGAVVVATGLHPLRVGGQAFTSALLFARTPAGRRLVRVDAPIPAGRRLV